MKNYGFFSNSNELVMIVFATGILLILFIPIPPMLLDLLLITNFSWALTILLLTFYTDKPISFSTFPALLLISTLFRLAFECVGDETYFIRWACWSGHSSNGSICDS